MLERNRLDEDGAPASQLDCLVFTKSSPPIFHKVDVQRSCKVDADRAIDSSSLTDQRYLPSSSRIHSCLCS